MVKFKPVRSFPRGLCGGRCGEIDASYADLRLILGVPWTPPRNGESYKTSTEWHIQGSDGSYFTVYDYKSTNRYHFSLPGIRTFRSRPSYVWGIGYVGGRGSTKTFIDWLKVKIAALHAPVETVPVADYNI